MCRNKNTMSTLVQNFICLFHFFFFFLWLKSLQESSTCMSYCLLFINCYFRISRQLSSCLVPLFVTAHQLDNYIWIFLESMQNRPQPHAVHVQKFALQVFDFTVTRNIALSFAFSISRIPVSHSKCKLLSMSAEKKMNGRKVIGTHDGKFHCDEILACAMLKLLPQYADATVKRTRNTTILNTCDIVVDVGGVFDPSVHRYDHHQR